MDDQLNHAPCGFLTLSEEGNILSINETLLKILSYERNELNGKHLNTILTVPARLFYQLYFVPLINMKQHVEEMYFSLESKEKGDIPVLVNAKKQSGKKTIECVIIPMRKRSEYENELLIAKKEAETALYAKHKANADLEVALRELEAQREELLELNKQNQKFKNDTKTELELARKIQETSLSDAIINDHIEIDAFYKASRELSGDIYGFYQIEHNRYGIILLDVMGHGISSALITMSLQSLFHRLISKGITADIVMKELDQHLHNLFQNNEETRHYCTAIYLLIDTDKQQIDYINAGHPPALWQDPNGQQVELYSTAPPIGTFEGIDFKTKTFTYKKGGRLLLYTDGVTDPLGFNHLCPILKEHLGVSLPEFKKIVINSLNQQDNKYHKSDDQCFIIIDLK